MSPHSQIHQVKTSITLSLSRLLAGDFDAHDRDTWCFLECGDRRVVHLSGTSRRLIIKSFLLWNKK
jgi:hypothetical protein